LEKLLLFLVGGGSCAGKTVFASQLSSALTSRGIRNRAVSTDLLYRDLPADVTLREHNFDSEESVDKSLIHKICEGYPDGISRLHVFDFKTHSRSRTLDIPPLDVLILEGIFALSFDSITSLPSLKIFIRTGEEERYARRLRLYTENLGHSRQFIDFKYFEQSEPYYRNKIESWYERADLIVSGEENFDPVVAAILSRYFPQPS
jgi:uridine kinase